MPSQILLSDAQRLEFTSVPETITDEELEYFHKLGESIYDALESGKDIRKVEEGMTTLDELREKLDSRFTPHEGDMTFHEKLLSGYPLLRRYFPLMLKQISFKAASSSSASLITALEVIRKAYERKSPDDIPSGQTPVIKVYPFCIQGNISGLNKLTLQFSENSLAGAWEISKRHFNF